MIQGLLDKPKWTQHEIYAFINEMGDIPVLTACIAGEAAKQPFLGKLYIACTVRNRVRNPRLWPNTYGGVLCKAKHFSCFNENLFRREIVMDHKNELWWRECKFVAWGVVTNWVGDVTGGATHYWNPDISTPRWASKLLWLAKVGDHQFAREGA